MNHSVDEMQETFMDGVMIVVVILILIGIIF